MFRTVPLPIIGSFSLYTQQWYMSYSLRAGSGRSSVLILLASCMTYTIAVCTVKKKNYWWWREELSETCRVLFIIIIIIIFLYGLGRLTCSGIDVLPSFERGVHDLFFLEVCPFLCQVFCHLIRRYPRLCVFAYEYFVFFGKVTNPSENPHSWRTSLSLLVWPLSYDLSGLGGPTRNIMFPPA